MVWYPNIRLGQSEGHGKPSNPERWARCPLHAPIPPNNGKITIEPIYSFSAWIPASNGVIYFRVKLCVIFNSNSGNMRHYIWPWLKKSEARIFFVFAVDQTSSEHV